MLFLYPNEVIVLETVLKAFITGVSYQVEKGNIKLDETMQDRLRKTKDLLNVASTYLDSLEELEDKIKALEEKGELPEVFSRKPKDVSNLN